MISISIRVVALTFLLLSIPGLFADAKGAPRLSCLPSPGELEAELLADAWDGSLDDFSLFEAALVAAGVERADEIARYEREFQRRCGASDEAIPLENALARTKRVFDQLHNELLIGAYRVDCTSLSRCLENGDYNCVTSTILFQCLCGQRDLPCQSIARAGHVFSRVDGVGDVQTTCPEWFSERKSGAAVIAEHSERGPVRAITPVQLLGKVYYNQGVAHLESGAFASAVRALRISSLLDAQDEAAQRNLLAAVNNWALAECDNSNFELAVLLLKYGRQLDPRYEPYLANDLHIHQKWAIALCQRSEFTLAVQLLERGYARQPDAELYDLGRFAVYGQWAESLLSRGEIEQACRVLDRARELYPLRAEVLRYEESAFHRSIAELWRQGSQERAVAVAIRGLAYQPESTVLQSQYANLTQSES